MRPVDEEEAAVQGCLPYRQGFGVVGGFVPGPQALHGGEFHDDEAAGGRPVAFCHDGGGAAGEVAAAMPGDRSRRQVAVAASLRFVQHLDFGDHVSGHDAMISRPRRLR